MTILKYAWKNSNRTVPVKYDLEDFWSTIARADNVSISYEQFPVEFLDDSKRLLYNKADWNKDFQIHVCLTNHCSQMVPQNTADFRRCFE